VDAWPFVGRDEQLRFIAAGYHDASVSGVVVVGDAGFGKTRLAREALARLAALGRRTEWVTATRSAAAIPLGAVSHLLPPECSMARRPRLCIIWRCGGWRTCW